MKKPPRRFTDLVLIDISLIKHTNNTLDADVIYSIMHDFDVQKLAPVMGSFTDKGSFILTDGNHRLYALKQMGYKFIYAVMLTPEEFQYVAFSARQTELLVRVPEQMEVFSRPENLQHKYQNAGCYMLSRTQKMCNLD